MYILSRHIPTAVVQGRYDVVCPATSAWTLKKVFPEATLSIVPDAGHSSREPGIAKLLVEVRGSLMHCKFLPFTERLLTWLPFVVVSTQATDEFAQLK